MEYVTMIAPSIAVAVLLAIGFAIGRLTHRQVAPPLPQVGPCVHDLPDEMLLAEADFVVQHVDAQFPATSGEYRRAQAMRMLLNRNPTARERDCALAIELSVRAA